MAPATIRFSAADYRALPEGAPRVELLDGEFVRTPAPSLRHQSVVVRLVGLLLAHLDASGAGKVFCAPCDVFLGETDVVQPDLLVVLARNSHRLEADGVHGSPDLVIEVTSPSTGVRDLTLKREIYRRSGVQEYWIVDPAAETVALYDLRQPASPQVLGSGAIVTSRVLPSFPLPVASIFAV